MTGMNEANNYDIKHDEGTTGLSGGSWTSQQINLRLAERELDVRKLDDNLNVHCDPNLVGYLLSVSHQT